MEQLYSFRNQYPGELPDRIRLSTGLTVTDRSTFTEEQILDAGYVPVDPPPTITEYQRLNWQDGSWQIYNMTDQEIASIENSKIDAQWSKIRELRENLIKTIEWKIFRHQSEVRLGLTPSGNINAYDVYMQELRNITNQPDPFNITWPILSDKDAGLPV